MKLSLRQVTIVTIVAVVAPAGVLGVSEVLLVSDYIVCVVMYHDVMYHVICVSSIITLLTLINH
jgi:hypothetical protein